VGVGLAQGIGKFQESLPPGKILIAHLVLLFGLLDVLIELGVGDDVEEDVLLGGDGFGRALLTFFAQAREGAGHSPCFGL
jgi:hypothetical protein